MENTDFYDKLELLVDSHYGIYIPQAFCEWYKDYIVNKDELKESIDICLNDVENEFYNEAWDDILRDAVLINDKGIKMRLEQNEDLWAIPENVPIPEDWYI